MASNWGNKRMPPEVSFWRHVNRVEDATSCWEWLGCRDPKGYGKYRLHRRMTRAHRAAWIIQNGELKDNELICHKCNNPGCVRLDHLYKGDSFTNMRDRKLDGKYYGKHNGKCKLSWEVVQSIRSSGDVSASVLAKKFGVHRSHIWRIRIDEDWKSERLSSGKEVPLNGQPSVDNQP